MTQVIALGLLCGHTLGSLLSTPFLHHKPGTEKDTEAKVYYMEPCFAVKLSIRTDSAI